MNRKEFIHLTSFAAAGSFIKPQPTSIQNTSNLKAIAFDAYAIFDPRPILKKVQELFPEQGKQIVEIWQSRQFMYQWLRVLGDKYKNFWEITKEALDFAMQQCGLGNQELKINQIMDGYTSIQAWPDVIPALQQIEKENLKVSFLSNMTTKMLKQGMNNSNLNDYFDYIISTDEQQTFKPGPKAYQMAIEKFRIKKNEILFVPFAGWDMAGAKWFGYPTFWLNRSNVLPEELDAIPDGKGTTMIELLEFVHKLKLSI